MKLRELLGRFRLRPLEGEGGRPEDNVDALATGANTAASGGRVPEVAPTNWVPSQQDERPRY